MYKDGGASAGGSARQVAKRSREKAERLMRHAELYERGAAGEERTAEVLRALPAEWTVLHDVSWPGRRMANIDHVVIGPAGIFVIDSKNWSGRLVVDGEVLRQNGRAREHAVAGCADAGLAISELGAAFAPYVVPVLCFVRDEPVTGHARDVMVCSTANLLTMLMTRPVRMTADHVRTASWQLDAGLRAATVNPPSFTRAPRRPRPAMPLPTSRPKPRARRRSRGRKSKTSVVELLIALALCLWLIGPGHQVIADALVHAASAGAKTHACPSAGAHVAAKRHPRHRVQRRRSVTGPARARASCAP